ncbi:UNKNOWN [Stylonychia lemnae]|uniref:N-acetyltransferase domain-containing protein n=1 Tax=Stylonychia lemnae TaxID=5949 RepID=A0A078AVN9_STYLE|nr:UNKNOWN [Stylonychia lemnae]|eukprot:CDW86455.1 UNKNOWN [Stylonychia lemnae]
MEKIKQDQTKEQIVIRKLISEAEIDQAMMMRFNELKNLPYYKNLEQFYDVELEAGRNMFNNGQACAAFNEKGEIVAIVIAFDLTFEPYNISKRLLRGTEKLRSIRQDARKILSAQPGEYCFVGYSVARKDYRRQQLIHKICLILFDDLLLNLRFKRLVVISVSKEGFLSSVKLGYKVLKYYGAWEEDDKNEYYNGGEIKEGVTFQVLSTLDSDKHQELNRAAKL